MPVVKCCPANDQKAKLAALGVQCHDYDYCHKTINPITGIYCFTNMDIIIAELRGVKVVYIFITCGRFRIVINLRSVLVHNKEYSQ